MASSPELSFDPASMSNAVGIPPSPMKLLWTKKFDLKPHWKSSVFAVLDDCIENIIADTVLKVHREEKQLRMQSAAIIAQQSKDAARAEASPGGAPTTLTTQGAVIDEEGRIFLRTNPLRSTPEILCPTCRLPRLLYPTMGRGARPPDPSKEYCAKQPYIDKDGCDIYGKALDREKPKKKKDVPDKKKAGSRSGTESPTESPINGRDAAPKPATVSMPSGKCPFCPRYMAFTRLALHMDRCMRTARGQGTGKAGSAAAASSAAQAKGTPQSGSRASTPKPGATAAAAAEKNGKKRKLGAAAGSDDNDDEVTPVKKKKAKKDKREGTPQPDAKGKKERPGSGTPKPKAAEKRPPV